MRNKTRKATTLDEFIKQKNLHFVSSFVFTWLYLLIVNPSPQCTPAAPAHSTSAQPAGASIPAQQRGETVETYANLHRFLLRRIGSGTRGTWYTAVAQHNKKINKSLPAGEEGSLTRAPQLAAPPRAPRRPSICSIGRHQGSRWVTVSDRLSEEISAMLSLDR